MPFGQLFVGRPVPVRNVLAVICLPLALLVAGCAGSDAEADRQAALAEALLTQGNLFEAGQAITKAIAERGDDPRLHLLDARIKIGRARYSEAYEAYQTVLALEPDNAEALVAVAVMARSLGDRARGKEAAARALALDPLQLDVLMSLGMQALSDKKYDEAMAIAEKIIAGHPSQESGYVLKARVLALSGRNEEGLALLRDTVQRLGNSVAVSTALLESARADGDVPTMREQYGLLEREKPDSVSLALDEVNLLYKVGDRDGARSAAGDVMSRFGQDPGAMTRLVELWTEHDPSPLGEQELATLRAGDALAAKLAVGRFLLDRGRLDDAAALAAGSPDPRAIALASRVAVRRGEPAGATTARAILARDTTNCDALAASAEWDITRRRTEAAVRSAQVLAAQCKDRIDGFVLQARAYDAEDRPAAVERVFRDGLATHPTDPELTRRFMEWLFSKGRGDVAVGIASKLTKVAPTRNSSWRLYAAACQRAGRPSCAARAAEGLAVARRDYRLEALPNDATDNSLMGRQWD